MLPYVHFNMLGFTENRTEMQVAFNLSPRSSRRGPSGFDTWESPEPPQRRQLRRPTSAAAVDSANSTEPSITSSPAAIEAQLAAVSVMLDDFRAQLRQLDTKKRSKKHKHHKKHRE